MSKEYIKNKEDLSKTKYHRDILSIIESGYAAIDTENVIKNNISLNDGILKIKDTLIDIKTHKNIYIVGCGKIACEAAFFLEQILKDKITEGAVIGISNGTCEIIETYKGTHPIPSEASFVATQHIKKVAEKACEDDLVIALIGGGGSALMSASQKEYEQGQVLYRSFLETGGDIKELNLLRSHISEIKGGGLAKMVYPASVIGLIFSDIPGNDYSQVASGPTFMDKTTVADAQKIIKKYKLTDFDLIETPKDKKYFEKVNNILMVSNKDALVAMREESEARGYSSEILGDDLFEFPDNLWEKINRVKNTDVVIAGGETRLVIPKGVSGKGGRNDFLAMSISEKLAKNQIFASVASDGYDNTIAAGAITDRETLREIKETGFDFKKEKQNFNSYTVLEKTKNLIMTGTVNANVSDLMVLMNKREIKKSGSRTQIVATLGPSSSHRDVIESMSEGNMDVVRLNYSWGDYIEHEKFIHDVRAVAQRLQKRIPIIADLSGPREITDDGHHFDENASIITEKDKEDLKQVVDLKLEYVAMSYVGSAENVTSLRALIQELGGKTKIIAKIERKKAIDNLKEIISVADAVMIARGDLGNDVVVELIPFIQKEITEEANRQEKPVIVATEMMTSMIDDVLPSRADVTDVTYAVLSKADAVMLSEETTIGKNPIEVITMVERILVEAEKHTVGKKFNLL